MVALVCVSISPFRTTDGEICKQAKQASQNKKQVKWTKMDENRQNKHRVQTVFPNAGDKQPGRILLHYGYIYIYTKHAEIHCYT